MTIDNDKKTRSTMPPEEDSFPSREPRTLRKPEPIARVALKAPPVPESALAPEEVMLRTLAAHEGKLSAEFADRFAAFEEQMKLAIKKTVVTEVKSIPPPPAGKRGFQMSDLQYVTGVIVAVTGLVGAIALLKKTPPEIQKQIDAIALRQKTLDDKISTERDRQDQKLDLARKYELTERNWIADVFDKLGVKVTDPPGALPHDPIDFYAPPKPDPHKVSSAHPVQPKDPMPLPPEP